MFHHAISPLIPYSSESKSEFRLPTVRNNRYPTAPANNEAPKTPNLSLIHHVRIVEGDVRYEDCHREADPREEAYTQNVPPTDTCGQFSKAELDSQPGQTQRCLWDFRLEALTRYPR